MDHIVYLANMEQFYAIERAAKTRICSFDDWLDCSEQVMEDALKKGAVALKMGLAYQRSNFYDRVAKQEAEKDFNEILGKRFISPLKNPCYQFKNRPIATTKTYQDYMMHHILRSANKKGLTVQIHTGIQEGNGNYLTNSDPASLTNLFLEYPDIKFDIFHIAYPYQNVLTVLAKNFPNVFIDMCWAHIVSPVAAINILAEWIECVPFNKISVFGGDYRFIDAVYGNSFMTRENVAKSLYMKMQENILSLDEAKEIAKMLFYDNPKKLFGL